MAGLAVEFDNIQLPTSTQPGPRFADLVVVTSGGISTLRNGVQVLPRQKEQIPACATLLSTYLVKNGELVFDIDGARLPRNYGRLVLSVADTTAGESKSFEVTTNLPSTGGRWSLTVPAAVLVGAITAGNSEDILVNLLMSPTPNRADTLLPILFKGSTTIVYLGEAEKGKCTLVSPTASVVCPPGTNTVDVRVALGLKVAPTLFRKAFPGFEESLNSRTATLVLTDEATNVLRFGLAGNLDSKLDAAFRLTKPAVCASGDPQKFLMALEYRSTTQLAGRIEVLGGPLQVTW